MAKKANREVNENDETTERVFEEEEAQAADAMDFNIDEEYKPNPLVPAGTYHAAVTNVEYSENDNTLDWTFTFSDNGGVMSDGETAIDGSTIKHRNFFPNAGDELNLTKSGKQTKRQAKINMAKDFADKLKINMNTLTIILESLANQVWLGMDVTLKISQREYQGRFSNQVDGAYVA